MTFHDASGNAFEVHRNDKHVTVMSGCSVVLGGVFVNGEFKVVTSHSTAPSKLAVLVALGLAEAPKPKPAPEAVSVTEPPLAPTPAAARPRHRKVSK